ncbi:hypothetical protein SBA1_30005 [Candidatus Sulfotelmatobacter kueseliae]|uniref:Uncharacterized protein n=1 Tax=Candidatus Sulfotelmatobacter kueseliae TaxID=2042962 RepID=A0A2U3KKG0_9BACT|nr:hypothetical protein SBA1_30005 [Candidatus Sulfotelmatobacter kueseliae]
MKLQRIALDCKGCMLSAIHVSKHMSNVVHADEMYVLECIVSIPLST